MHVWGTQEATETGGSNKKYTEYVLRCRWTRGGREQAWLVARRYSEFDAVNTLLQPRLERSKEFASGVPVPALPKKSLFGWSTGAAVVEERRLGLAKWMEALLRGFPWAVQFDEVDRFLTLTARLAPLFNAFAEEEAEAAAAALGVDPAAFAAVSAAGRDASATPARPVPHPASAIPPGRLASLGIRVPSAHDTGGDAPGAPFSPSVAAARAALGSSRAGGGRGGADGGFPSGIFSPTGAGHGTPPRSVQGRPAGAATSAAEAEEADAFMAGLMSPSAAARPGGSAAALSASATEAAGPSGPGPMPLDAAELPDVASGIAALDAELKSMDLTRTDPRKSPALQTLVLRARLAVPRLGVTREALMRAAAGEDGEAGSSTSPAEAAALLPYVMQLEEDATSTLSDYQSVLAVVRAMGV